MAAASSSIAAPLEALTAPELIDRYVQGVHQLDPRILDLTDAEQDSYFRAEAGVGRWSCRVLVGHLADAELVMSCWMRRAASEERPILTPWDHEALIDARLYAGEQSGADRPLAGSIAVIHTLRLWAADWLRSLEPSAWSREALHPEEGPISIRQMLEQNAAHIEHHARFLTLKIDQLRPSDPSKAAGDV